MKQIFLILVVVIICQPAGAQITITSADMPVAGDTLRYSNAALPDSLISPADSGANISWNYPLAPISQGVDSYQLASSVNFLYALTVGTTAAGYKVADSLPLGGILPISIQQVYTFFEVKSTPTSLYEAKAFAANISGIPTAINYSTPDIWYKFPLSYLSADSTPFKLNIGVPGLDTITEVGHRVTRVDGWGTITTPYYTSGISCIRVRSEIHQVDSVGFGPIKIGFPVNTVEYKWLVNGDHYPALWVTSNLLPGGTGEVISSVRYRDEYRDTAKVNKVATVARSITVINAMPNPAVNGTVTLDIPVQWQHFTVVIYDMQSREVARFNDQRSLDISALPSGSYLGCVVSGSNCGFVKIVK